MLVGGGRHASIARHFNGIVNQNWFYAIFITDELCQNIRCHDHTIYDSDHVRPVQITKDENSSTTQPTQPFCQLDRRSVEHFLKYDDIVSAEADPKIVTRPKIKMMIGLFGCFKNNALHILGKQVTMHIKSLNTSTAIALITYQDPTNAEFAITEKNVFYVTMQ